MLGAETYAFADAFDLAYCAKTDLEKLLDRRVSLSVFTDSKSLFDVIAKSSHTQEIRLMIDQQAVSDAYAVHDVSNVGFIRGPNNPADGLTKIGNCHDLYHLIRTGKSDFIVEPWILRNRNGAITTNYLSTVPFCYNLSCRSSNIHSSRDITSSYGRLREH